MSKPTYRLYAFANYYLSPLQAGLQTAHVVSELSLYKHKTPQHNVFNQWALIDRTIIILNGGNSGAISKLGVQLRVLGNKLGLPTSTFYEDQESLNCAATVCGIIVPDTLWNVVQEEVHSSGNYVHYPEDADPVIYDPFTTEHSLIDIIKSYRLF